MASRPIQKQQLSPFLELYEQGVRLFQIDATFSEDLFHPELRAWKAPGVFDYTFQESYWQKLLSVCPEAKFCLRIYAGSPPWWDENHPGELQKYADGGTEASFQRTDRKTLPSLASGVWRKEAKDALEHFLEWLEYSGWAERIWGFLVCNGITWEWGILGTDRFPDYSEPMRRRFREWLRENYRTESALRESWGRKDVTFGTAEIPGLADRLRGEGDLRIFPRDRPAADFQNCLSDTNCEFLLELGSVIRQAGRKYQVGTFYGYTLTAREHNAFTSQYGPGGLAGGHHAFGKFLRAGIFDYVASPYAYADRDLGKGCLIQHFSRASAQWHGLRVYDENDLRTFLVADCDDDRTISIGQTHDLDDSLRHQRWALAQSLCHGTSYWWTELSDWIGPYRPNFAHPEILEELRRHVSLHRSGGGDSRSEPAEIAIILDERSIAALAIGSKLFRGEVYDQLAAWSWCGAPFDVWLADDVTPETMRRVKLAYIFSPAPSVELRQRLKQSLCRGQRTIWWGPYAGWMGNDRSFQDLTGHEDAENISLLRRLDLESWTSLYGRCQGKSCDQLELIARQAGVKIYGNAPFHVMKGADFLAVQSQGSQASYVPEDRWTGVFSEPMEGGAYSVRELTLFRRADAL